ncbi:MAG: winged helix DNA-binding domain-containing protein [Treponema sp.]|nr:winged helix DNA-binding domain-containing protein [Treponema sp.]
MIKINNSMARTFLLLKQGLIGEHRFKGKQGAFDYIKQAGCIQFDPVDVCGKNAELTLQSRVKDFRKEHLSDLLYTDRKLFDYPDKMLSIIPTEYWPYFERFREAAREHLKSHPEIEKHIKKIRAHIKETGAICSSDIELEGSTAWWSSINWSTGGNMLRSVLEQMYSSGDLIVHHKKGTRRFYDITERHIPGKLLNVPEPLPDDYTHQKWRVLRRIGAVGLIRNRPSHAFLGIRDLSIDIRKRIFSELLEEGSVSCLTITGMKPDIKDRFYYQSKDEHLVKEVLNGFKPAPRCELIAPLDPFMWDRKLIETIFGFQYTWEIYTPPGKRKYGAYVLPMIFGEDFIGRVEAICERKSKSLIVKNIWYEEGIKRGKKIDNAVSACLKRFALFNDCPNLVLPN